MSARDTKTERTFPFGSADGGSTTTLFAFPHAGAGASCYRDWCDAGPGWLDVRPVQLPGREGRWLDEIPGDVSSLVRSVVADLEPELARPFALYGHSFGAMIAAEVTYELVRRGLPRPVLLVVSGYSRTSQRPVPVPQDDGSLVRWIAELGGTDPRVLADDEMRSLLLPVLRADLELVSGHRPTWRSVPVPVLAMGGTEDSGVSAADLDDWRRRTTVGADVRQFRGGHFFNHQSRGPVLAAVVDGLEAVGSWTALGHQGVS